jgi:Fe-S cluster assembly protein SufD
VSRPFLSPDAARALGGPDWLVARRVAAAESAAAMAQPSPTEELWRYSRISDLDLAAFPLGVVHTTVTGFDVAECTPDQLGSVMPEPLDLFGHLNDAFGSVQLVHVPKGHVVSEPIVVDHVLPDGAVSFPRLVLLVDDNAEVTVVERFRGAVGGVVAPVLELRASSSARVRYQAMNELANDAWAIAGQVAVGDRDSSITMASIAEGGGYSRVRTLVRLAGQGAHAEQIGVSFGEYEQMHDLRVSQVHDAPRTTSDLQFRSAVQDSARSVYTGLIRIEKHAKGCTAFQTNRNLKLSEQAWAESVPNLEIENNDVKCSHASTVGPIDADQRFYLESRGIPTAVAERLVVLGFFDDVVAKLPAPKLASWLHESIAAKLDRRIGALV